MATDEGVNPVEGIVDCGIVDYSTEISVTWNTSANKQIGIITRWRVKAGGGETTNPFLYLVYIPAASTVYINERGTNGSVSNRASAVVTSLGTDTMKLTVAGGLITGYWNGNSVVTYTTATNLTSTKTGLVAVLNGAVSTVEYFKVTP